MTSTSDTSDTSERFDRSQIKALSNRFWVAKDRAQKEGKEFAWTSFSVWLDDFMQLVPEDFDMKRYRIVYDQKLASGYCKENMTFQESAKSRLFKEMSKEKLHCALSDDERLRLLLASEITLRLSHYEEGDTLEKIISEAAKAVGFAM